MVLSKFSANGYNRTKHWDFIMCFADWRNFNGRIFIF